jgi:acylphosphatase
VTTTAHRLVIRGRVQGVGFRAWMVVEARRRELRGWVRNCRDGSVEALVIGAPEAVEAMIAACRGGPPAAEISAIERAAAHDDESPGFAPRPTP